VRAQGGPVSLDFSKVDAELSYFPVPVIERHDSLTPGDEWSLG
jgi:hypothetical protein